MPLIALELSSDPRTCPNRVLEAALADPANRLKKLPIARLSKTERRPSDGAYFSPRGLISCYNFVNGHS
jgi:hypothetical protein